MSKKKKTTTFNGELLNDITTCHIILTNKNGKKYWGTFLVAQNERSNKRFFRGCNVCQRKKGIPSKYGSLTQKETKDKP